MYLRLTNKVGFKQSGLWGVNVKGIFRHTPEKLLILNITKVDRKQLLKNYSILPSVCQTSPVFFITQLYCFNSWNIWKYNLMHLTHNTFTTYYLSPYWQYNTVQTLIGPYLKQHACNENKCLIRWHNELFTQPPHVFTPSVKQYAEHAE